MTQQTDDVLALRGQDLHGRDGEKIGTVEEIYLDNDSGRPEWALVTTGLFGSQQSFVPIGQLEQRADGATVPYDKATVKDAPTIDPDGRLSESEEQQLYRHYGLDWGAGDTGSGTGTTTTGTSGTSGREPVGRDVSGPTTDEAMTRSEEELTVGKTERESGRVRLRKYVVEDQVTQTVPVRREEVRLEREPITDANVGDAMDGPAISEEEHEVVLHQEEPVVQKRAVPKERVRLDKDVEVEQRTISDTVRKEQIDVDDRR